MSAVKTQSRAAEAAASVDLWHRSSWRKCLLPAKQSWLKVKINGEFPILPTAPRQRDTAVTWTAGSSPWPLWRSAGQPTRNSGLNQSEKRQQLKSWWVIFTEQSINMTLNHCHPVTWACKIQIFSPLVQRCAPWNSFFLSHSILGGCNNKNYWFSAGHRLLKFPFWPFPITPLLTVTLQINTHCLDNHEITAWTQEDQPDNTCV